MRVETVVLYHITDKDDIPTIEKAIREDDEGTFLARGPYFRNHRGKHFLLNEGDIGHFSDARDTLVNSYDPQGGLEVTGTEAEMRDFECLLDSDNCYSCFLENRLLILPKQQANATFLAWMKWRASPTAVVEATVQQNHDAPHYTVETTFQPVQGISGPLFIRFLTKYSQHASMLASLLRVPSMTVDEARIVETREVTESETSLP